MSNGQNRYGVRLHHGFGTSIDLNIAAGYYILPANQENALGQLNYGFCLLNGVGASIDLKVAAHYFNVSAEQPVVDSLTQNLPCLVGGFSGGCCFSITAVGRSAVARPAVSAASHFILDLAAATVHYEQSSDLSPIGCACYG
jgi:hypothetical protein